jgi:hypothetical protein
VGVSIGSATVTASGHKIFQILGASSGSSITTALGRSTASASALSQGYANAIGSNYDRAKSRRRLIVVNL